MRPQRYTQTGTEPTKGLLHEVLAHQVNTPKGCGLQVLDSHGFCSPRLCARERFGEPSITRRWRTMGFALMELSAMLA